MSNVFKSQCSTAIGTTDVVLYTVPASTTSTVIGLSVANLQTSTMISVSVLISKGSGGIGTGSAADFYLVKNAPIAPGGTLVVIGGDQKTVLESGNGIKIRSNTAASADAVISFLEIT